MRALPLSVLVLSLLVLGAASSRAGDVLLVPGAKLATPGSALVADSGAPGGKAVQSQGKAGDVASTRTPPLPAGRYKVTARVQVLKRTSPQHLGRLLVQTGKHTQFDEHTVPFGTTDFARAGVYRDFSITVCAPPVAKGQSRITARVVCENPKAPIRVASIEIRALAVAPVLIEQVWPEKLLARPDSAQPITVTASNATDQAQNGLKLALDLICGLNQVRRIGVKELSLKPYETVKVAFDWNTGQREYGYEARATLTDRHGKVLDTHADYFAVSRSHFKLRIFGSPRWMGSYLDKRSKIAGAMHLRQSYSNYVEVYGWPPSAFVELYPRHRFWASGQVCAWRYDRDAMKAWIDEMHRLGMYVTSYNISLFNGWAGMEVMRKHPEWCAFNALGRPAGGVNAALLKTRQMAYADDKPTPRVPFVGEMPNVGSVWPANDALMRRAANEIVLIHKKLGFDGMRWDGHPIVYVTKKEGAIAGTDFGKMVWDHTGKRIVDAIPGGDMDRQSLHNIRLIKQTVRKAAPEFEWGYNAGYDLTAEQQPRTWKEVAVDAGIWVEGGFRSGDEGRANPSNTWAKYMLKLWLSSQYVIRSGGYPIHGALGADSKIMRRFLNAIFFAQGSHVCWHGGAWGEYLDMSRFATRYCQYLYDPRIRPWWGEPDIHVTGWVQWADRKAKLTPPLETEARIRSAHPLFFPEKMLFHRVVSNHEKDTILHLVNHPGKPYVDYMEMKAPPVQEDITVSLRVPAGMKAREARCLSPDRWPMEQMLALEPDGDGRIKLTVPRLECWNVVVVSWRKEG
jgi:hypothetical protein